MLFLLPFKDVLLLVRLDFTQLENLACFVRAAGSQELRIETKRALENVAVGVRLQLLHRNIILAGSALRPPDEAGALARACDQEHSVGRYGHGSDWPFVLDTAQVANIIGGQVPYPDSTALVSIDNVGLIWVQNTSVDHHTVVFVVAHESGLFEVKDLQSSIFRRGKEPFIIILKAYGRNIAGVSLIDGLISELFWSQIKYFDQIISSHCQMFSIIRKHHFIDLRACKVNGGLGHAR